jgi:uncharacterized cupin superfamily protein
MATIFRSENIEFKEDQKVIDNFRLHTATPRLFKEADSKNLIFDIRLLNPGQFSFPYHFHRHAEELIMIISGTMTLRTQKGLDIMSKGDIVFFEMGESSAHQFYNHSEEPCTYLDIRTLFGVDICEYPDSGKINIIPSIEIFDKDSKVEYFKGEENILEKWDELKTQQK